MPVIYARAEAKANPAADFSARQLEQQDMFALVGSSRMPIREGQLVRILRAERNGDGYIARDYHPLDIDLLRTQLKAPVEGVEAIVLYDPLQSNGEKPNFIAIGKSIERTQAAVDTMHQLWHKLGIYEGQQIFNLSDEIYGRRGATLEDFRRGIPGPQPYHATNMPSKCLYFLPLPHLVYSEPVVDGLRRPGIDEHTLRACVCQVLKSEMYKALPK